MRAEGHPENLTQSRKAAKKETRGGRRRAEGGGWRAPLAVWIAVAVVAVHGLLFWAVWDKGFLPKARYVPPPPTPNFGVGERWSVDPQTGETTTERQFQVSTRLATPKPEATPSAADR